MLLHGTIEECYYSNLLIIPQKLAITAHSFFQFFSKYKLLHLYLQKKYIEGDGLYHSYIMQTYSIGTDMVAISKLPGT